MSDETCFKVPWNVDLALYKYYYPETIDLSPMARYTKKNKRKEIDGIKKTKKIKTNGEGFKTATKSGEIRA